jgi:hypothetical protein
MLGVGAVETAPSRIIGQRHQAWIAEATQEKYDEGDRHNHRDKFHRTMRRDKNSRDGLI